MLSSSLDKFFKLSMTKSPPKLFDYDCITLSYICFIILLNLFLSLLRMKSRHLKLLDNPPV